MINFAQNFSKRIFGASDSFAEYVEKAKQKCDRLREKEDTFKSQKIRYSLETAKEELGLDAELIDSLLEDFVKQVIETLPLFRRYLTEIQKEKTKGKEPNFQPFRDLAHKNLGVARNLRIEDAQKILTTLMKSDDPDVLMEFIEYIEACVVLLKPQTAYETYKSR